MSDVLDAILGDGARKRKPTAKARSSDPLEDLELIKPKPAKKRIPENRDAESIDVGPIFEALYTLEVAVRTDPNELGLKNVQLYPIEGELAKQYLAFLETIGYKADVQAIGIDKTGFSPQVAEVLGPNYMGNWIVIASAEQFGIHAIRQSPTISWRSLDETISNHIAEIAKITSQYILTGEIKTRNAEISLSALMASGSQPAFFEVSAEFDTPSSLLNNCRELMTVYKKIEQDPDMLLDGFLLSELKRKVIARSDFELQMIADHGAEILLRAKEDFVKAIDGGIDIYAIRKNGHSVFVYFDPSGRTSKDSCGKDCSIINGSNREKVLDMLVSRGFAFYSAKIADWMHAQSEKAFRIQKAGDIIENGLTSRERDFSSITHEERAQLLVPLREDPVLYELIARVKYDAEVFEYMLGDPFKARIDASHPEERVGLIRHVMDSIKTVNDYNLSVNSWLKKKHSEACNAAGARFVEY